MRFFIFLTFLFGMLANDCFAQPKREDIYSEFVFYGKRQRLEKDLRENIIGKTFDQELTTDNEHRFESACSAITQFQYKNESVEKGLKKIIASYDSLQFDTKRAMLEMVYAIYPTEYAEPIREIFLKESTPKLFALCASYLKRADPSINNTNELKLRLVEQFPEYDSVDLLIELEKYLTEYPANTSVRCPPMADLFNYQKQAGNKIIYSFQRWNRDYPGLAIVQNKDGSFVRREDGRLMVFQQLARSGSSLPYFLTNGNTPQGIYSIQSTGVSRNNYIGPTPNIQLQMPFEDSLEKFFHHKWDSSIHPMTAYLNLLPPSWRQFRPIQESFAAGKIGRTEIIAHGSTIDPEYFKDKPYYPLTPTLGCLCAKEIWNVTNGKLLISEQYNLVSAFMSTPGNKGYLIVVNLDNQFKPVSREEIEKFIMK
ncbi:MAG: hypothetical protein H7Y31_11000 [Chitinophagaceae bacterium]|nr:hypothetical protein [Chitinophagaceae bacterium]